MISAKISPGVQLQSETDILERSSKGDLEAFRILVNYHQNYVFAIAFKIVCDEDDAKDIVQESFIRVWKHIDKYDFRIKFTTWLYRITVNLCFDKLKMRKRKRRIFSGNLESFNQSPAVVSPDIETETVNRDLRMKIESISEGLTPKQKIVFTLRDLQEMSLKEIAQIIGISINSVKTNLHYARKNIRRNLEKLDIK